LNSGLWGVGFWILGFGGLGFGFGFWDLVTGFRV